jgi:hypothetical protein
MAAHLLVGKFDVFIAISQLALFVKFIDLKSLVTHLESQSW